MPTRESTKDLLGVVHTQPFPISRTAGIDTVAVSRSKHHIPVLLEVDVTDARAALRKLKEAGGVAPSFTGWAVTCLGRACAEHPRVHAMREGRERLMMFDDVDVSIVINREVGEDNLPVPYVIRKANEKSFEEISREIREVQSRPLGEGQQVLDSEGNSPTPRLMRLFFALPQWARKMVVWNRLLKNPAYAKKTMGTVTVSSVGMYGGIANGGTWFIPAGITSLVIGLGGISSKPGVVSGAVTLREYLSATVEFDHDVVDGAHVFRFVARLRELLEGGYGL